MYSGQLETRSRPDAGEPSSAAAVVVVAPPGPLPEPHAARTAGPSTIAAAAAAPRPRNCLRDVRLMSICMRTEHRDRDAHRDMSNVLSPHDDHAVSSWALSCAER